MDTPIILIDSNYIGHQARYVLGGLSHGDIPTGVIFGFLSRILSLSEFLRSNRFIFCWDSRHSYRRRLYPDYKKRPERTPEEMEELRLAMEQFVTLRREILPMIGFSNVFLQQGCEADDLMAKFVQQSIEDIIIVSADEDLFQLLTCPNVKIFNPSKKKFISREDVISEHRIRPEQWSEVKAIGGCRSDNVPGIRGVGEGFAIKFLRGELADDSVKSLAIRSPEGQQLITRNRKLVRLPISRTKPLEYRDDCFSMDGLRTVVERYGLESLADVNHLASWEAFFKVGREYGRVFRARLSDRY